MEKSSVFIPNDGDVVFVKEADLKIVADMQNRINELEGLVSWAALCLMKGEIIPALESGNDKDTFFIETVINSIDLRRNQISVKYGEDK